MPKKKTREEENPDAEKSSDADVEILTKMWFFFCMVWSVGATLDETGREKFDAYIREMDGIFPVVDTIYDYYVNVTAKSFIHWKANLSSNWTYPEEYVLYRLWGRP